MIGIEDIIYIKNEMHKVPGGGSIIIINDTYSLYEDETVTVSVGTYSKTAVIDNGTATIKGFTETGMVTVSVSDFTTTFNIDKYSKYEVGVGSTGNFSYTDWLASINESASGYSSLADVLADEKMVRELFTRHASVDYLVSVSEADEIETIINDDYCAKWINLRDYALDTLYANQLIASLMDQADKYFYGEWTIIDSTTTPPTWGPKGNVPIMTSNTAPYGEASASSSYPGDGRESTKPYRSFRGILIDANNCWIPATGETDSWIKYKFVQSTKVQNVKIVFATYAVTSNRTYKIQASNDNDNWTDLSEICTLLASECSQGDVYTYVTKNIKLLNYNSSYLYYRILFYEALNVNNISSNIVTPCDIQFYGRELRVSVPPMTSNTAPYGVASASSLYSQSTPAYKSFDNDSSSYWAGSPGALTNQWIQYKFNNPVCIKKAIMKFTPEYPSSGVFLYKNAKIQASNDGSDWITLHEWLKPENQIDSDAVYLQSNVNSYLYYRLFIVDIWGTESHYYASNITSIQFYGFDYSEYDWDTDNPRHYIYDHGVELKPVALSGSATKEFDAIKLSASGAEATAMINTTDYTLLRGDMGMYGSGTNNLKCSSGSATYTAGNLPYNQSLDISSINGSNITGVNQTTTGVFTTEEIWVE